MKLSLVHTLHRLQKYGQFPLEYYKPMLTDEQYKTCISKTIKTWYPLTQDLMVAFIYHVSQLTSQFEAEFFLSL